MAQAYSIDLGDFSISKGVSITPRLASYVMEAYGIDIPLEPHGSGALIRRLAVSDRRIVRKLEFVDCTNGKGTRYIFDALHDLD